MVETRCGMVCSICKYRENLNCKGCIVVSPSFTGDACPIKVCRDKRRYTHCALCPECPCELTTHLCCSGGTKAI